MPGADFTQLGGQWLFQEGQHASTGLLFTAEGALMSHKGCYGCSELTLLYFSCQMGRICQIGTSLSCRKFRQSLESISSKFIILFCEQGHLAHLNSADSVNANLQAV